MNRKLFALVLAALFVAAFSLSEYAKEGPVVERPGERPAIVVARHPVDDHPGLERLIGCLPILDLSPTQQTEVQGILDAAKPTVDADSAAVDAARTQLRNDVKAGADKCVIGQDFLNLHAAEKTLHEEVESIRDQIVALLTQDQKMKLRGCLEATPPL